MVVLVQDSRLRLCLMFLEGLVRSHLVAHNLVFHRLVLSVETNKLEITLMGGVFGELIWEEIILETDTQEIRVPITARWIKITAPASISENSESLVPKHKEGTQTSEEHRTFKGKSCSLCGRNFSYDSNNGTWEQCKCNWYQMAINIGKRIIIDLRSGAKEIPSYLEETWRMVLGKEKL